MNKWLKSRYLDLLVFFLGALLPAAFAPYNVFPLAIILPAALLFFWLKATPTRAFWLGIFFGCGYFGTGVYWVFISIHRFGGVSTPLAVLFTGGFIVILSIFPASVGYILNRYFPLNTNSKLLCAFPALWVLSEWIRSWIFTGFPWLLLGYSQTNSPLNGFAPILSVFGVSLAVIITSALLVNAYLHYQRSDFKTTYYQLFTLVFIWISGALLGLIPWTHPQGPPIPVSLVQGNIPQELKWSADQVQLSVDRYVDLTKPLWKEGRLIVWPEAAVPVPLQYATTLINELDKKAMQNNARLFLGIPIETKNKNGYYNAVISVGKEKNYYLKRHLVPFGEYTPLESLFSNLLKFMDIPMADMISGKVLQDPMVVGDTKILTSICYEIAFPTLINTRDRTVGALLTVTNDAWFGKSAAQNQHLQMAQMRAIELRRPILVVSNDGVTAIVGPDGKIAAAAPSFEPYVLNGSIQPTNGLTPWMQNGLDPLLFLLIAMLVIALRAKIKQTTKDLSQSLIKV